VFHFVFIVLINCVRRRERDGTFEKQPYTLSLHPVSDLNMLMG